MACLAARVAYTPGHGYTKSHLVSLDIEHPTLESFPTVLTSHNEYELLHRAVRQPLSQLCQDAVQIRLKAFISCDEHGESIFVDPLERLGRVDSSLVQNGVD